MLSLLVWHAKTRCHGGGKAMPRQATKWTWPAFSPGGVSHSDWNKNAGASPYRKGTYVKKSVISWTGTETAVNRHR